MKTRIIALSILVVATIFVIAQSLPISRFPNTPTPLDSDLFVLAQTQFPATNKNIRYDQLRGAIRSGLATEAYVNAATQNLSFKFEVKTNSVALGFVTNINWTYGMTGSLSSSTAILGVDDSANTTTVSNGLISQIIIASNSLVSANAFRTNQFTTNIAGSPVNGEVKFQGFPGRAFVTNNARNSTLEWEPTNQSVRIGSLSNDGVENHHYLKASNYWDNPNIGLQTYAFGSNHLVNASFSAIASGIRNLIYTNATMSFIASGTNCTIETNAALSFIGGGKNSHIHVGSNNSFIGSGEDLDIIGASRYSGIVSGSANQIRNPNEYCFMGGGLNNNIGVTGGTDNFSQRSALVGGEANVLRGQWSFIGGGRGNLMKENDNYCVNVGGQGNLIGIAPAFGSTHCFIGGGFNNNIQNDCTYGVIVGGVTNIINGASSSNGVIVGGAFNSIGGSAQFASILGGERHSANGKWSFAIGGASNSVSVNFAGVLGYAGTNTEGHTILLASEKITVRGLTNATLVAGVHATPTNQVAGAGTGSTNYTLLATTSRMYLGSSNVNIVAVMNTSAGLVMPWTAYITNLSADTWGIRFDSATNRWKFQSYMYGTNAPVTLTNNTLLRINGESEGTNTLVTYEYFKPAL